MTNHLDNLFNSPVRRIDEIIIEMFKKEIDEIGGKDALEDLVRKEKCSAIDSIFRGAKLAQCHDYRFVQELRNPAGFFDKLYELDLDTLDAYSKALDKKNTQYMQAQVLKHNNGLI